MWIKISVLIFAIIVLSVVEGRGGRGGGARGGSRSSSRGRSGSSSAARIASQRYRGPVYSGSSWKTAAALGTLYGVSSYQRRRLYLSHPDRDPNVCFNADNLRNGTYGYFICPEPDLPDDQQYCCGDSGLQKCCTYEEYKQEQKTKAIVGAVIGGLLSVAVGVGVVVYCVVMRKRGRSPCGPCGRATNRSVPATYKAETQVVSTTITPPPAYSNSAYSSPSDYGMSSSVYNTIPTDNNVNPTQNGEPPKYGFKDGADGLPYSSTPYPPAADGADGLPYPSTPYPSAPGGPTATPNVPPPPYTTVV